MTDPAQPQPAPAATLTGTQPSSMASSLGIDDPRVEITADYLLRRYRQKPDRWVKFYNNSDNHNALIDFFNNQEREVVIFVCTPAAIDMSFSWPDDPHNIFR
uniref:Uncharacterized protein n=1 Tax=Biomphalaria glabrata TaxID=6526 RepID=A0A2C9KTZ2_BIOGL